MSQHEEYTSPPGFRISGVGGTKLAPVLIDPATPPAVGDTLVWNGTMWMPVVPGGPEWLMSGEGSPVDSVTPVQQGAVYQDLTNGGLYLALGATDADWVAYGGVAGNVGEATGLIFNGANHDVYLLAGSRDEAAAFLYIGSAWEQWNGPGNGITLLYGQDEGNPSLAVQIKTGIAGEFVGTLQDVDGRMIVPGLLRAEHGVMLATSDPHIAGALWNNAGTPAISSG
jgi:hypothetical protein